MAETRLLRAQVQLERQVIDLWSTPGGGLGMVNASPSGGRFTDATRRSAAQVYDLLSRVVGWFVITDTERTPVGATDNAEDAAALIAARGSGHIEVAGKIVWHEGGEHQVAAESYDFVATIIRNRTVGGS